MTQLIYGLKEGLSQWKSKKIDSKGLRDFYMNLLNVAWQHSGYPRMNARPPTRTPQKKKKPSQKGDQEHECKETLTTKEETSIL